MNERLFQNIIQALIHSAHDVFQTMIFMDIQPKEPFDRKGLDCLSDITGVISLTGSVVGSIILSMDTQFARKAVSNMLGDQIESEQEVVDGVGEITNMVVGMAKTELANLSCDFEISVPVMIVGKGSTIKHLSLEGSSLTTIPFMADGQTIFHLELYAKDAP
ncbi:MAG: chemotaxis protein CheX [bacterium]|nr:chemotaxis protein CheX [bacterium]